MVRLTLTLGVVGLAVAVGVCVGILQKIHPLNQDFEKLTKLMLALFGVGLALCLLGLVIYGN